MEQNQQVANCNLIVRLSEEEIQRLPNEQEQCGLTVKEYGEMIIKYNRRLLAG